jgi:hypothetical protein
MALPEIVAEVIVGGAIGVLTVAEASELAPAPPEFEA